MDGDKVYSGILGGHFIGNNKNAIQVKGLNFSEAHSDANYNINNFKFIDNGSITDKNHDLLKNLYPLDGYRKLRIVGEKK